MFKGEEYCGFWAGENESASELAAATRKRKNYKNKRRFSDEQIKSLELMFESESRLEPRKKLQLARELGLHPRQVAIWFQNKRARWKSKQLEQEYSVLRANYNSLASKFDALKKEKQALALQLQKLNELVKKAGGEQGREVGTATTSTDGELENGKPPPAGRWEQAVGDDHSADMKAELFGLEMEEEPDLISMADASMTSSEDWGSLDSDGLFDQSSCSYQWWDFWS